MQKTSLIQKLFLVAISLLITMTVLEAGLRIAGFIYSYQQNKANQVDFDDNEVRILCVGESTTAMGAEASFPSQLEELLNQKSQIIKFKVINKGMISKTSEDILNDLKKNIEQYRPKVIVSMIGVNDYMLERKKQRARFVPGFIQDLRVYKLFSLIGDHLRAKSTPNENEGESLADTAVDQNRINNSHFGAGALPKSKNESVSYAENIAQLNQVYQDIESKKKNRYRTESIEQLETMGHFIQFSLGILNRKIGQDEQAEKHFEFAAGGNQNLETIYLELALIYKERKDYKKAVEYLERSLKISSTKRGLMEMARLMDLIGNKESAKRIFMLVVSSEPESARTYYEIGNWFEGNDLFRQAEYVYLKGIQNKPNDYINFEALGVLYKKFNSNEKSVEYEQKTNEIKKMTFREVGLTQRNYNKINDIIKANNIKLIAMQYPLRSIDLLKGYFENESGIIFVENKTNFEEALVKSDYDEYFTDRFAFDFGHCTRKGNRLIAENLAQVILNKINLPDK